MKKTASQIAHDVLVKVAQSRISPEDLQALFDSQRDATRANTLSRAGKGSALGGLSGGAGGALAGALINKAGRGKGALLGAGMGALSGLGLGAGLGALSGSRQSTNVEKMFGTQEQSAPQSQAPSYSPDELEYLRYLQQQGYGG